MEPILCTGLLLAKGVGHTLGLAAKSKKAQISAGIRQVAALLGQSEDALHDGLRYEHDARSGEEYKKNLSIPAEAKPGKKINSQARFQLSMIQPGPTSTTSTATSRGGDATHPRLRPKRL